MLGSQNPIKISRWPSETPLTWITGIFAAFFWFVLLVSLFGILYALLLGLIFFFAHVGFIYHVRGNGVRLSAEQFPELYKSVEGLSQRMGFQQTPEAYLIQEGGILNALATRFFKADLIVLFSELIDACGDDQAARDMIIAHELGHLKEGHLRWHWFFLPGYFIPFLGSALSRAREYTCDRYGLAGAGNTEGALKGLAILAAGAKQGPRINLKAFAEQAHVLNTGWMTLGEWFATHPPLSKRVIALSPELKPKEDYTQRGVLRAFGIIGLVYGIPVAIGLLIILGVGIFQLSSPKKSHDLKEKEKQEENLDPFRDQARADVKSLATVAEKFWKSTGSAPNSLEELEKLWKKEHPDKTLPIDPYTKGNYVYKLIIEDGKQDFEISTPGPDGEIETEDDVYFLHSLNEERLEKKKEQ